MSIIGVQDQILYWKKYQGENLMSFFSNEDWHQIFPDVHTHERLREFFSWSTGVAFVAYEKTTNKPFAFLYIYIEDKKSKLLKFMEVVGIEEVFCYTIVLCF
jgi:hypothetical protein